MKTCITTGEKGGVMSNVGKIGRGGGGEKNGPWTKYKTRGLVVGVVNFFSRFLRWRDSMPPGGLKA